MKKSISSNFEKIKKETELKFLKSIIKEVDFITLNSREKTEINSILENLSLEESSNLLENLTKDFISINQLIVKNDWFVFVLDKTKMKFETVENKQYFNDFLFSYLNKVAIVDYKKVDYFNFLLDNLELNTDNKSDFLRMIGNQQFEKEEAKELAKMVIKIKKNFKDVDSLPIDIHKITENFISISNYNIKECLSHPFMKDVDTKNYEYVMFNLIRFSEWQEKLKIKSFQVQKIEDLEKDRTFFNKDDGVYLTFYENFVEFLINNVDEENLKKIKDNHTKHMLNLLFLGFNLEKEFAKESEFRTTNKLLDFLGVKNKNQIIEGLDKKRENERLRRNSIVQSLHLSIKLDNKEENNSAEIKKMKI